MSDKPNLSADDVRALLERIDALEGLFVCYRIGKNPPESLWRKLERTKDDEARIRQAALTQTALIDGSLRHD